MAWLRLGGKPLSEPMMAKLTDAYASLGLNGIIFALIFYFAYKTSDPELLGLFADE